MEYVAASLRSSVDEGVLAVQPILLLRVEISMTASELRHIQQMKGVLAFTAIVTPDAEMVPGVGPWTRIFYVPAVDAPGDEAARNLYVEQRASLVLASVQGAYEACLRR